MPTAPALTSPAALFPPPWWVYIECRYRDNVAVGPYPTQGAAQRALNHSPGIQGLTDQDSTASYTTVTPPRGTDEHVLVDAANPADTHFFADPDPDASR